MKANDSFDLILEDVLRRTGEESIGYIISEGDRVVVSIERPASASEQRRKSGSAAPSVPDIEECPFLSPFADSSRHISTVELGICSGVVTMISSPHILCVSLQQSPRRLIE